MSSLPAGSLPVDESASRWRAVLAKAVFLETKIESELAGEPECFARCGVEAGQCTSRGWRAESAVAIITDINSEVPAMSSIIVRGLDDAVKERLVAQARLHGRSMEAEVRDILTRASQLPNIGVALMRAAQSAGGVDELPVPERADVARTVGFE